MVTQSKDSSEKRNGLSLRDFAPAVALAAVLSIPMYTISKYEKMVRDSRPEVVVVNSNNTLKLDLSSTKIDMLRTAETKLRQIGNDEVASPNYREAGTCHFYFFSDDGCYYKDEGAAIKEIGLANGIERFIANSNSSGDQTDLLKLRNTVAFHADALEVESIRYNVGTKKLNAKAEEMYQALSYLDNALGFNKSKVDDDRHVDWNIKVKDGQLGLF
jgi:hypothetical protein